MNLRDKTWEAVKLGAINGLLFGTLSELIFRSMFLYERYVQHQTPISPGLHIQEAPYPFNWWYLPALFLVLVTLASLVVHRYLTQFIKSAVWLWLIIGIVAVFGCGIYAVIMASWYQWRSEFDFLGMDYLAQAIKSDLKICLLFLPIALAFNLLFSKVLCFWKVKLR
jgi:hypothetical protein